MNRRAQNGNGDQCPLIPDHGRMYVLPSGRQYCADQTHDADHSPNLFEKDGRTPAPRKERIG